MMTAIAVQQNRLSLVVVSDGPGAMIKPAESRRTTTIFSPSAAFEDQLHTAKGAAAPARHTHLGKEGGGAEGLA